MALYRLNILTTLVTSTVVALFVLLPGAAAGRLSPEDDCLSKQLQAAARLYGCLVKADRSLIKDGDTSRYEERRSKCVRSFESKWGRIEARTTARGGTCPTTQGSNSIQGKIGNESQDLTLLLGGACTTGGLPKTGQAHCYEDNASEIPCAGTGQDGDVRAGVGSSFVNNGNGTISDISTGLMWSASNDAGGLFDKDLERTLAEAFGWIDDLNGHCDDDETVACNSDPDCAAIGNGRCGHAGNRNWALPNPTQLLSLVQYATDGRPALVDPAFEDGCTPGCEACSCTAARPYWTSSAYLGNPIVNWFVPFDVGSLSVVDKLTPLRVRAVRYDPSSPCPQGCPAAGLPRTGQSTCHDAAGAGGIPCEGSGQDGEHRLGVVRSAVLNSDRTITDVASGLTWEVLDDSGGPHSHRLLFSYDDALDHCESLGSTCDADQTTPCSSDTDCSGTGGACGHAGYRDWRLPNVRELQSIVNYGLVNLGGVPATDDAFRLGCTPNCSNCSCTFPLGYWTSTNFRGNRRWAFRVAFNEGDIAAKDKGDQYYARCVRGGTAN